VAWSSEGRHILAHFDAKTIVDYEAYRLSIGEAAIELGVFGGEYSESGMRWIKPNFMWNDASPWSRHKVGQEIILGLRLRHRYSTEY
jgi:hypothetical protein